MNVLNEVCAAPDLRLDLTPEEMTVFGEALTRAHAFALEGRSDFLEVLMYVSTGPYGRTAEGAEWLSQLLWEVLERHPGATLAALAENGDIRAELVESVYTRPVHDGFDFAAIVAALRGLELPEEWAHMEADVRRIVAVAGALAEAPRED